MTNMTVSTPMTITEALQEIKTINARLTKKRQAVAQNIARDSRILDPFDKNGGSAEFVRAERQGIHDLEQRVVKIRTAIQRSNLEKSVVVGGTTRTVAEWLTWRREVSNGQKGFLSTLSQGLANLRREVQQKGGSVVGVGVAVTTPAPNAPPQIVVNLDEKMLVEEQENMEQLLGDLDGKLSLFNATTVVTV